MEAPSGGLSDTPFTASCCPLLALDRSAARASDHELASIAFGPRPAKTGHSLSLISALSPRHHAVKEARERRDHLRECLSRDLDARFYAAGPTF